MDVSFAKNYRKSWMKIDLMFWWIGEHYLNIYALYNFQIY